MNITDEQLKSLEDCQSAHDWREACNAITAASESKVAYPDDWWEKVVESGLMDRVTARWGASSDLTVSIHDNLPDALRELLGKADE